MRKAATRYVDNLCNVADKNFIVQKFTLDIVISCKTYPCNTPYENFMIHKFYPR